MNSKTLQFDDFQTIEFEGKDTDRPVEVFADNVLVVSCSGNNDTGSSKVKLNNVVDYSWEERFYTGQLLAVHRSGKYIAYGIKAVNMAQTVIRVVNLTTSKRALIKGVDGMLEDLAFAHHPTEIILACVNQQGTLLVFEIEDIQNEINYKLILQVQSNEEIQKGIPHRIFWCPYVPVADYDGEYETKLLAITRNNKVEIMNVPLVCDGFTEPRCVEAGEIIPGHVIISAHSQLITEASFSPDGSAIATSSQDGQCKFYQVYLQDSEAAKCLHEWTPHGGKPVTTLFFLDNHKDPSPSDVHFWKFAVTGTENNSELKIWSCETWECLQTIRITNRERACRLKVALDLSASYIIMTDIVQKVFYILELHKSSSCNLDCAPFVSSISEFRLTYPILSFGIVDASIRQVKANSSFSLDELCNGDGEESSMAVVCRMYIVQPKSLQECTIVFPSPSCNRHMLMISKPLPPAEPSGLAPSLDNGTDPNISKTLYSAGNTSLTAATADPPINLMTPDAFNASANHDTIEQLDEQLIDTSVNESCYSKPLPPSMIPHGDSAIMEAVIADGYREVSGGSSPSREVEEILGLQDNGLMDSWSQPQVSTTSTSTSATLLPNNMGSCEPKSDSYKSLETKLTSLASDMAMMLKVVKAQNQEIRELRAEMSEREVHLGTQIVNRVMTVWSEMGEERAKQKTECSLDKEELAATVAQAVHSTVVTSLEATINKEIRHTLTPAVCKVMDRLKDQCQAELAKKLTATDVVLKETLQSLIPNQAVVECLSAAVTHSVEPVVLAVYKKTFESVGVPQLQRSLDSIFERITTVLNRGTAQNLAQAQELRASVQSSIAAELEASSATLKESTSLIDKSIRRLEENIAEAVRAMSRSAAAAAAAATSGMASRAVTPGIGHLAIDPSHLLQLAQQGHYNSAFQQALSAADLNVVTYLCDKIPPSQVFTDKGCVLAQHVLLSLIQQLSADMTHLSETKFKYLEEAVINLNSNNPPTREHMPTVLSALSKQLQIYISANPNSKLIKRVRMLHLATRSLLC